MMSIIIYYYYHYYYYYYYYYHYYYYYCYYDYYYYYYHYYYYCYYYCYYCYCYSTATATATATWTVYSNRLLIGRLPIGIIGHSKQSAIGLFMLSGQSVNVANRPIDNLFQSANRDICSMWPIGQCHQSAGNTNMYEKMSNFYEG